MKRIATRILESIGNSMWGFRPNLMKDIVDIHGGAKSIGWFMKNMPRYESTLIDWGEERTHMLAAAISSLNGCQYSTYGQSLSFQLHYFVKRADVFPISEHDMMEFASLEESEIIAKLNAAFESSKLYQQQEDLQRLMELKLSPELARTKDDARILQMDTMFEFMNNCGIEKQTPIDYAHSPVSRNVDVYLAYKKVRRLQSNTKQIVNQKPLTHQA